jgi:hypothetical protein
MPNKPSSAVTILFCAPRSQGRIYRMIEVPAVAYRAVDSVESLTEARTTRLQTTPSKAPYELPIWGVTNFEDSADTEGIIESGCCASLTFYKPSDKPNLKVGSRTGDIGDIALGVGPGVET